LLKISFLFLKTNDGHRLIVNISSPQRGGSDETIILKPAKQRREDDDEKEEEEESCEVLFTLLTCGTSADSLGRSHLSVLVVISINPSNGFTLRLTRASVITSHCTTNYTTVDL
jgi:hypothetical protein